MIELIYNEEQKFTAEKSSLKSPKNVKQIGEPENRKKIYIEETVHTFLRQYHIKSEEKYGFGILLGNCETDGNQMHLYVKGAIPVESPDGKCGAFFFNDVIWGEIYRRCREFFPRLDVMGWFLIKKEPGIQRTIAIEETHRIFFSGADKIFLMKNAVENDCSFFEFNGGGLERLSGYSIYNEKNEAMDRFVSQRRRAPQEHSREMREESVANFRKLLKEKEKRKKLKQRELHVWGSRAALAAVVLGGVLFSLKVEQTSETEVASKQVIVEELPGEVTPAEMIPTVTAEEVPVQTEEAPVEPLETEIPAEASAENISETTAAPDVQQSYQIQAGDSLAKISREHYGTAEMVRAICELNGIQNENHIQVGQEILLP